MKSFHRLVVLALCAVLSAATGCGKPPAAKVVLAPGVAAPSAEWLAAARAAYPLKTCAVADHDLASMGPNIEYIYQAPGQEPRMVVFCCDGCVGDFNKDPAKYLAKLDAAKP